MRTRIPGAIDTTSRSRNWSRGLSPFFLGPVELYDGYEAKNVENGWQFSKVYADHIENGEPTSSYWTWAEWGWMQNRAYRYPMGKGTKPTYSLWDGEKLGYVEARKKIYCSLYARAVEHTDAFKKLKEIYAAAGDITLFDFDSYDLCDLNTSYQELLNCPDKKMGHGFVLGMLLDNERVWE